MQTASQGNLYPDATSSETRLLAAFTACTGAGRRMGDRTLFACPVHGDHIPTLSVRSNPTTAMIDVECAVGCDLDAILSAVGLSRADLVLPVASDALADNAVNAEPAALSNATFTYLSAEGQRLGQVVYRGAQPPRLRIWNPDTARWGSGDFGCVLYRLPELAAAAKAGEPVWLVGTEEQAELLAEHQAVATCAHGGWGSFGIDHVAQLGSPSRVVVAAERTRGGYWHANRIRTMLAAVAPALAVDVVEPAVGRDIGQHLAAGRALGEVVAIDPARQLLAPDDPTAPTTVPNRPALSVAPQRNGGRGGGGDDSTPNRAAVYAHRHGQTVQVRYSRARGGDQPQIWYEVIWNCEVRVRKITYQDLAESDADAARIPGSWLIELRRRIIDDSGHYLADSDSIDGFAYETVRTTIAAEEFHTPGWPDLLPWAGVIANETPTGRAKARAAAIAVSGIRHTTPAFAATGWRESNGSAIYVHPGGAIGDSGALMGDVTLDLPPRFAPMAMATPLPTHGLLSHAVEHGLDPLVSMLPAEIAAPLIGYAFRTFLGKPRGSIHLMGAPGTGKTVVARVCGMSWTSTSFHEHGHTSLFTGGDKMDDSMRALALLMHAAKDALVLVDEFKGRTAQERINALHTLFWNGNERSVSTTRGTIRRSSGPPRCGLITTGEVGSVGSSATRTLTMAINRDVVADPIGVWSHLESAGARAWRAQLGASFVQWLAADHETKVAAALRYGNDRAVLAWQEFAAALPHTDGLAGRLVAIASEITVGWAVLLEFLRDTGAISAERSDVVWRWAMGGLSTQLRAQDHSVGDGAEQLLSLIREAMTCGAGHATDRISGEVPAGELNGSSHAADLARAFGWFSRGRVDGAAASWSPRGNHLGVVDSTERMLYLFPRETLATMASLTARVGEHFTATSATITSSLGRRGWLGVEGDGTRRSRIRVAGVLTSVWPVPLAAFYGDDDPESGVARAGGPDHPLPPWSLRPRIVALPVVDEGAAAEGGGDAHVGEDMTGGGDEMTQEMLDFSSGGRELRVVPDADGAQGSDTPGPAQGASCGEAAGPQSSDATQRAQIVPPVVEALDDAPAAPLCPGEPAAPPCDPGQSIDAEATDAEDEPVALRPLVVAGGEDERWLYAAATVTDSALVLPDGEEIPITIGADGDIQHLGDLVDLAAALHLGWGGGRAMPEPPTLLLTKQALQRFGVSLPDAAELAKSPDPFAVIAAAGAAVMNATVTAGYSTGDAGTLRIWTKVWRGKFGAEFVVLPAVEVTDPHSGLLSGTDVAVDLAYRAHRVAELLGTTYSSSGAITGRRLYERLHPPGGRALTPTELVPAPTPLNNPRRMAVGTLIDVRPFTEAEARQRYIHGYDLRANYLTAAGKAIVGIGAPEHHPEGIDFDPKTVGLWRLSCGSEFYPGFIGTGGGHTMLPNLMALAGRGDAETGWFTTPTVRYLATELDLPIQVHEAYTWATSRRLLETWAKHVNAARVAAVKHLIDNPRDTNGQAVRGAIKAIYTGFIGRLAYGGDCDSSGRPLTPWHRPDWRIFIQAEANVDLHRKTRLIGESSGRYPIAWITDEVLYTSDEADPVCAKPEQMTLGVGLGQWDPSRTYEVSDQLIDAAARRAVGEFNNLIPKKS